MPPVFGSGIADRRPLCGPARSTSGNRGLAVDTGRRKLASSPTTDNLRSATSAPAAPKAPPPIASSAAKRLVNALRDRHALAGGEPVGFDYQWRAALAHMRLRRFDIGKTFEPGGRDVVTSAQFLGEGSSSPRAARPRPIGPKASMPSASNRSTKPATRGASGPDHDEVDRVIQTESDEIVGGVSGYVDTGGVAGNAAIAWRAKQCVALRRRPRSPNTGHARGRPRPPPKCSYCLRRIIERLATDDGAPVLSKAPADCQSAGSPGYDRAP